MQERTRVVLDHALIRLRTHQTLLIPALQRAPLDHYRVHLMYAWDKRDIDLVVPTSHLISPEGFSLASVTRALHRASDHSFVEIDIRTLNGRNRYHFRSQHHAAVAALQQRIEDLAHRARGMRQRRVEQVLAAPASPSMTLQVDQEIRVDLARLSRRNASGSIDIIFVMPDAAQQIDEVFGPARGPRYDWSPIISFDIDQTLAGLARYRLSWRIGVTTTLVVEIGSRAASDFHQYMMRKAGHDDTAADTVQLPIAVHELSRSELERVLVRLRNHALQMPESAMVNTVTDEVWMHVLARRLAPRDLVYPEAGIGQSQWTRLCTEAVATQQAHQYCNDWFLRQALPRLPLAAFNHVIDAAGRDATAYLRTLPPLLRQLDVPFSGLDPGQLRQACRHLRNAWLTAPAEGLASTLRRHRLLRSSTLLDALAERGSVVTGWLLPDLQAPPAFACAIPDWSALASRTAIRRSPAQGRVTHRQRFMRWRHLLNSSYPDYAQLQRAELKRLLREQGHRTSLHALALLEFEQQDTDQRLPPVRLCLVDDLLLQGVPDEIAADAAVYQVHTQSGQLSWRLASIKRPALELMLMQAHDGARRLHHAATARYWKDHGEAQSGGDAMHAWLLSAQACMAAHDLCDAGYLSVAGLRLVTAAAGFDRVATDKVQCHLFDLAGVISIDLVTIRGSDGGVVLYRPGQWPPLRQYSDMAALRRAIADDCTSDIGHEQWASHFDPQARRDSFKAGIDTLLLRLGHGEPPDQVALAEDRVRIEGDVFHQVALRQRQAALELLIPSEGLAGSPWNDGERFFDDDPDLSAPTASGAWMDALVAALDLHERGQPAWDRHSDVVATPVSGVLALSDELQRDLLQTACRQEQEHASWHQRAPDIAIDGARYMQDFLLKTFPERFIDGAPDVDDLVLNEYHPPQSHVAFYMFNDIDLLRRRKASIPLSQLSYRNIDIVNAWESLVNGGERYFTVSHKDAVPAYYDDDVENLVDPETLVRALIDGTEFDFATHHQQQIARYFTGHAATLARLARERALLAAQLMMHEGQLSRDDYQVIVTAFNAWADRNIDVVVHPLRISGHAARDCLHLHCKSSGRRVLYLAGDETPYRVFGGRVAARKFLLDLGRDKPALDEFAHTHFAREDADERRAPGGLRLTLNPGVIGVLRTTDQAAMYNADPTLARAPPRSRHDAIVRRRSQERLAGLLDEQRPISGDPFMALVAISRQGAMADADYFIRSASDRARQEWMEYARIIPVDFVEGLVRLVFGTTADDLRMARLSLATDLILTLIPSPARIRRTANPVIAVAGSLSAHALVRHATRREPVAHLARWFKPPQPVNGKIGYPLSPLRAPLWQRAEHKLASTLLDMRVCNATTFDAQAIAHSAAPRRSSRWHTVASQALRLDRAATGFLEKCVLPKRAFLREIDSIDDLFELAYRSAPERGHASMGRGLVVGENHSTTAARRFLDDHLERLSDSGVKTLYTEVFKRDADNELLRIFNDGGDFPEHVLARLDRLDANATPRSVAEFLDGRPSASLLALFDKARRHGLEVRAIDNVTAAAADYLYQAFASPHPRTSSMNYVAWQIIRHDQAHFRRHAWVAHVGAGHAIRDHGIPGINELTATPSVFVHSRSYPTPRALGDYHLAVDDAPAAPRLQPSP